MSQARERLVEYSVRDHVGHIRLNRPEKLNAINLQMQQELMAAFGDVRDNDDVRVAIIGGTGRAFSTGDDLTELGGTAHRAGPTTQDLYMLLRRLYKPLIGAINGLCLAQGCGLALSCDIRIASRDASFGWPQVRRGVSSVSGPTMLARQIPLNQALEILLTGDMVSAERAAQLGLVNKVVEPARVLEEAEEVARRILEGAPLALRAMKEVTLRTATMAPDEAYTFAELAFRRLERTEDAQEGFAAFKEKRKPVWRGR